MSSADRPADFLYEEHAPPAALAAYVRCVWRMRAPASDGGGAEPILPDGCVELVVNHGAPFVRANGGDTHMQPLRMVVGPTARAVAVAPSGGVNLVGIRFHPWAAAAFLGVAAHELTDRLPALDDLAPTLDAELRDETPSLGAALDAVARQARRARAPDARLRGLVEFAARASEATTVRGLAKDAGVGVRRLQAVFAHDIGLTPKQLARVTRLQRAMRIARASEQRTWGAVAAAAGYFDHAHFIRECRGIAGRRPSEVLGHALTERFLDGSA